MKDKYDAQILSLTEMITKIAGTAISAKQAADSAKTIANRKRE